MEITLNNAFRGVKPNGRLGDTAEAQVREMIEATDTSKLTVYTGELLELGAMEAGRMVGVLAQAPGSIAGYDVAPGQVWVFVCDGSAWTGYLAGGGSGGSGGGGQVAGARPAPKASQVSDRTARITWPEVTGATGYELRVNSAAADTVTSPHDLAGLSPDSNVMVEVRAILPAGPTAWGQASFRTSSAPMESLALRQVGASAADTITLFATEAENDSARGKNVQWGGHAQTVKRLPGNGNVEFTLPRAATGSTRALLTEGRGQGFIGVNWTADGTLTRQGGKYAGGVPAPEANSSTRFRLGRNDDEWFLDQKQGNSWVRIGSQPRSGERAFLEVRAAAGDNQWEITGLKGSGWA